MNVAGGCDVCHGARCGLAGNLLLRSVSDEDALGLGGAQRCRSRSEQCDRRPRHAACAVELEDDGCAAECEIAVPPCELDERSPGPRRRHGDGDLRQELVGLERSRQMREEELLCRQHTLATRRSHMELRVERRQRDRELCGGIGVSDRSTDGAAVPNLHVPDEPHGVA